MNVINKKIYRNSLLFLIHNSLHTTLNFVFLAHKSKKYLLSVPLQRSLSSLTLGAGSIFFFYHPRSRSSSEKSCKPLASNAPVL